MADIDPAAVKAAHEDHAGGDDQCAARHFAALVDDVEWDDHCAAYLLADALIREQAKVARVQALVKIYRKPTRPDAPLVGLVYGNVADDLDAALADQPEQGIRG